MKSIEVKAIARQETGKRKCKNLRKNELIPGVLYGGEKNQNFSVVFNDIRHLVFTPNVYTVDLNIDGKTTKCVMKDIQSDPVSDQIIHMDFHQIFPDKKIMMKMPVVLNGSSEGVKQGGKLKLEMRLLKVRGFYKDFPDQIDINVDNLGIGKSIRVGDLQIPNLEFLDVKNLAIVSVKSSRAVVATEGEAEKK